MKRITLAIATLATLALISPSSAPMAAADSPKPTPAATYGPQPPDQPMGRSWVSCPDHGIYYEAGWKPWIKDPTWLGDPYFQGWSPWGPTIWDPATIEFTMYPEKGWNLVCKVAKPKAPKHHHHKKPVHRKHH